MLKYILLFTFVFLPGVASAQTDSVSVGVQVIEEFYTQMTAMVRTVNGSSSMEQFHENSLEVTNETSDAVRGMRWVETPGKRRYERVYKKVDAYTDERIRALEELAPELSPENQDKMESIIERLRELKKEKLGKLEATLKAETYDGKEKKPVPIIDKSPKEKDEEEGSGIWFR